MKNKNIVILTPIFLAIAIVLGIFVGMGFNNKTTPSNRFIIYPRIDKLNSVLNYIEEDYVDTVDKDELIDAAIPMLLKELDPHSIYIPAKDLKTVREPLEGNFSGIGVQFNMQNDTVAIIKTISNGPSEKIGILPGDRIVTVDKDTVAGVKMPSDSIVKRLKGPRGTNVDVGIHRRGVDELIHFDIVRDNIPLTSVDVSYMVTDSIGFIKISKFSRTTFDEFLASAEYLKNQGMTKLIIDLRDNSGGYMDQAINIADQFLEEDKMIVYTEGKARPRKESHATANGICLDTEVVIILNEWSASASEILAGAIQDNDRGTIIGRRSFGKGLVQEERVFKDGSAMRLTIARYYTPTGRSIQKPYENGYDDYYADINTRFNHGELLTRDSIYFEDTLKYKTPEGKIVYGGGGIMPDIFIPIDTVGITNYFTRIRNMGLVYRFAFQYTDRNREKLSSFEDYKELQEYLEKNNVMRKEFVNYAKEKGVQPKWDEIKISEKYITTQLYAYISRNIFDNSGFYPILQEIDNTQQKGIEVLQR